MTRPSPWSIWAWLMVGFVLLVIIIGAAGGLFLSALVLDVLSFWPLYLVGIVLAVVFWLMRQRLPRRLQVLPALFVLGWVVLAVVLHFARWTALPSAAGDLSGPPTGAIRSSDLSTVMSGSLRVSSRGELLYQLEIDRQSGSNGIPEALESVAGEAAIVRVREALANDWFQNGGWKLRLAVQPEWDLELKAQSLDADLRALSLAAAEVEADGSVQLPAPSGLTEVTVAGDLTLSVPRDSPAAVVGVASVPPSWIATEDGWRAPTPGDGHEITVISGTVAVIER